MGLYFWTTKDNYYGPITVQFDKNATGGTDPRTMRFDTTGKETDGYKAAVEAAEAIKAQGGVDYAAYSVKAADGWALVETKEKSSDATFNPEGSGKPAPARARAPRRRKPRRCRATSAARVRSTRWISTAPLDAPHPDHGTYYVHRGPVRHPTVRMFIDKRHHLGRCHAHDG